jgi:putative (di)nucleoside polyphosphate hydrolase
MRFTGADADINLATAHLEFDTWEWVRPEQLPELIVLFMRQVYLDVLAEFRAFWSPRSRIAAKIVKA